MRSRVFGNAVRAVCPEKISRSASLTARMSPANRRAVAAVCASFSRFLPKCLALHRFFATFVWRTYTCQSIEMKLHFRLDYNTIWGERLHVDIVYRGRDGSLRRSDLPMNTDDGQVWTLETTAIESRQCALESFTYIYKVKDAGGNILRSEWDGVPRTMAFDPTKDYFMPDSWRDIPLQSHLYTNAYLTATHGQPNEEVKPLHLPLFRRTVVFRVSAPQLRPGQSLGVCGGHPAIGDWSESRYIPMQYAGQQQWLLSINVAGIMNFPLEYKYVVVDGRSQGLVAWEEGDNRTTGDRAVSDGQVLVLDGGILRLREQMWRAAGVAVPVFALRSRRSYGVGDFGDLRRMVDWAVLTGQKVIQLLPVNDTTMRRDWMDSSPYNAVSCHALHPHYVDLEAAGVLSDKAKMTVYHRQRLELNTFSHSDYCAVDRVKRAYLDDLFAERGATVCASGAFKSFVNGNKDWLMPYAAFCLLRDKFGTARFGDWKELSVYDEAAVGDFCAANSRAAERVFFVQYLLHSQLKEAADYARSQGVVLMGDLSVGVSRDSVEVWTTPRYFNTVASAGTPPDTAYPNGQVWGIPTYNWDALAADGYRWWHRRLEHTAQYFDAIRIDHVLGYFRIWEIPAHAKHAQLGHFSPSLPMAAGEIEYFGLTFRRDLFTRPFINDKVLDRLFGVHADYVRANFLVSKGYGLYDLREEYGTQRKIEAVMDGKTDENSIWIREGLYQLLDDVLFIEDSSNPGMYHPRINACQIPVFTTLAAEDKDAFMRIYNHYFYQRHNLFWGAQAMKRLPNVLKGTRMLVCGEDLGMLPDCVEPVLDTLRILTTEVQTLPKQPGFEFAHLGAYPYRSMAATSTHDMPTLRLWWEENREAAMRFYVTMLQKEGRAPEHLPAQTAEEIIARHLYCPSMLCVLPIQDWLAMSSELRSKHARQERINTPSDHYNRWEYRMALTIEELLEAEQFNRKIKTMVTRSKR